MRVATVLLMLVVAIVVTFSLGAVSGSTWVVDDDGGEDFTSIDDAVDGSSDGDTIIVYDGTYTEKVTVDVEVTITGNGTATTHVAGSYGMGSTIKVTADNVTVSGLNVSASGTDAWDAGVYVFVAENVTVSDCNVTDCEYGVLVTTSNMVNVTDCVIVNNTEGLYVSAGENVTVRGCTVAGNDYDGVEVASGSTDCVFGSNNITLNNRQKNYQCVGFKIDSSDNLTLRNNRISKTHMYLVRATDSRDCAFEDNDLAKARGKNDYHAALEMHGCDNDTVIGNNVTGPVKMGLRIEDCENETVVGNYAAEAEYLPFHILDSRDVNASDNWISDNNQAAIVLANVSGAVVTGNTVKRNNGNGITLSDADGAVVRDNECHRNRVSGIYFWRMTGSVMTGNNVTFNNLYEFLQPNNAGITLRNSTWNNVSHNHVSHNPRQGVYLFDGAENNTLYGNDVVFNCGGHAGVYVNSCPNTTLMNNNISNSTGDGLQLFGSEFSVVTGNTLNGNNMNGTQTGGMVISLSDGSLVAGNSVCWNNGSGLYIQSSEHLNATNNEVRNNTEQGIHIYFSDNITVHDSQVTGNGYEGIYVSGSTSVLTVENDIVLNNQDDYQPYDHAGLHLYDSSYCNVTNNYIRGNPWYGLRIYQAHDNEVVGNQIVFNCGGQSGIYGYGSDNIEVWYNNISNNTGDGLELHSMGFMVIKKNTINGNNRGGDGSAGIYASSCDELDIWHNEISRNHGHGVNIYSTDNPYLWDNEVHNNTDYGVRFRNSGATYVRYCNITGSDHSGVYLYNCDGFEVGNNDVLDNNQGAFPDSHAGIFIDLCSVGTIGWNQVLRNTEYGVTVTGSDNVTVTRNTVAYSNQTGAGMYLDNCDNLTVSRNTIEYNWYHGIDTESCKYSVYHNNTIRENGRPGWWYGGVTGDRSTNETWYDNDLWDNNGNGIGLYLSYHVRIENNSIKGNSHYGAIVHDSVEWHVANNTIAGNKWGVGFLGNSANGTIVAYNEIFYNDDYGVRIHSGSWNYIHHNNFYDNGNNTSQGYDNGTNNMWDDCSEGNYWDDWSGSGNYSIDGGAKSWDEYPLGNATNNSAPEKVPELVPMMAAATIFVVFLAVRRRRR